MGQHHQRYLTHDIWGGYWLLLWVFSEGTQWSSESVEAWSKITHQLGGFCWGIFTKGFGNHFGAMVLILWQRKPLFVATHLYIFAPLPWGRPREKQSMSHPVMALGWVLASIIPWITMESPCLIPVAILQLLDGVHDSLHLSTDV